MNLIRVILGTTNGIHKTTLRPETSFLVTLKRRKTCHENACYKSFNIPSCIDIITSNKPNSFQNMYISFTRLSDFHAPVVTVLTLYRMGGRVKRPPTSVCP